MFPHTVFLCPPAPLVRMEAHARMLMAQQVSLPVCVPTDFLETFVRSALTAVSRTPASTVETVQTTAWPLRATVHPALLVSLVMTPAASQRVLAGPAPTRACVLVNQMEPSAVFARNGLQVPHVLCSTDQKQGPNQSAPGPWTTGCLL